MKKPFAMKLCMLTAALVTTVTAVTLPGTAHAQYAPQPYPPAPQPYPPAPQPYPAQAYPPPGYYAPPTMQAPARLPYHDGQDVPPGYSVTTHARRGLVIGGAVTFGVLYALSLIAVDASRKDGHTDDNMRNLYIPAIGPFIAASNTEGSKSVLYLDGLGQVAGLAMFVSGLAFPQTELVRNDVASVRVLPMVGQGKSGMTMNVTF